MKRKELKNLAQKIAKLQMSLDNGEGKKSEIEEQIMKLCSHVESLEDISAIDEMVLEIIEKEKNV